MEAYICIVETMRKILRYSARDFQLEWKNKAIIGSSIIYLISIIFICLHAFERLDPDVWNALFWIIMMFSILSVVGRSFDREAKRFIYHFHLTSPAIIMRAKLFTNAVYSMLLGWLAYTLFSLFIGNQIQSHSTMFIVLTLGSITLGITFTLNAAMSARIQGNLVLTSILSLPILLPLIIVIVRLTERAFYDYSFTENLQLYLGLILLNVIIIVISYLLFPYLWRD